MLASISSSRNDGAHSAARAGWRRAAALVVAAFAALALNAAPAVAQPTLKQNLSAFSAPAGALKGITPAEVFDNLGTNPKFTDVTFSNPEYIAQHLFRLWEGTSYLVVTVKASKDLNALPSPPPSTFTFTATVTVANDEGQTATGTITLTTKYTRTSTVPLQPTFIQTDAIDVRVGALNYIAPEDVFDHAGTNPRFRRAVFSTRDYYKPPTGRHTHRIWVQVKTSEELSRLAVPPPSPFTVSVWVEMSNDEGQTAGGTLRLKTSYLRFAPNVVPLVRPTDPFDAPPGSLTGLTPVHAFYNVGTNPRFTSVEFSSMEYYDSVSIGNRDGYLYVQVKNAEQLRAMAKPPPSPFTVTATVTMTNDEGATGTRTLTFETKYFTSEALAALTVGPTAKTGTIIKVPRYPRAIAVRVADVFDNAGTNPVFTRSVFSTRVYHRFPFSGVQGRERRMALMAKPEADLKALATPPPNPFDIKVTLTMTNDEVQTATGTFTVRTTYAPLPPPTLKSTYATLDFDPAHRTVTSYGADDLFDNAGTNPRFTNAVFSATEYFDVSRIHNGNLEVLPKSTADLDALTTPPPNPLEVTVKVTMKNDEGKTATATITIDIDYVRAPT